MSVNFVCPFMTTVNGMSLSIGKCLNDACGIWDDEHAQCAFAVIASALAESKKDGE